ncbi:MAG TPA: spore coat U domain-containing protein [Gammaproteobacteria bacterium]|jgi:spore coat protein U-like protein|nr:spore coat U domain-containing protein [Gammaproteobacteria bacterium]
MNIIKALHGQSGFSMRWASIGILLYAFTIKSLADVSNISMSAIVVPNCQFSGGNSTMSFGSYDPTDSNVSSPLNSSASFILRCSQGSAAVISLSDGLNAVNGTRRLTSGIDNYLNYNLYKDSGRSIQWNMTNTMQYTANSSKAQTFTIYGQIPAGQVNIGVGSYSDTVTINVTF